MLPPACRARGASSLHEAAAANCEYTLRSALEFNMLL